MKKLTKMLATGSMLVGLAACGNKSVTPWQNKIISFLQEQGYSADLPLDKLAGLGAGSVEIGEDAEGNAYAKAVVKGDITFDKVIADVLRPIILGNWVIVDADETESAAGHYWYSFKNDFQSEGQYANVEIDIYETGNAFEVDPCIVLTTCKGQGTSAAEVQAMLDSVIESLDADDLFLPETGLADVAAWYDAEVGYADLSVEVADALVDFLGYVDPEQEYVATDYYYETYGITYVYNYYELEDASLEAAATRYDGYINLLGAFETIDAPEYDEENDTWSAYYEFQECVGLEMDVYDDEEYGRCVDFYLAAVSEDAIYPAEIAIKTPDFDEEKVAALNELIDDEAYDIDATFEDTYGYFAWGKKEVKPEQTVQVQYLTVNSEFELFVNLGNERSEWPADAIAALTSGFTTVVPALEGTCWVEQGDTYVFISNLDKADHKDPACFEQEYLALFEDNAEWTVEEGNIDMGITVPGYVATSTEVINVGNQNFEIGVVFFTYNYQFYCEVHISEAVNFWFEDEINDFTTGAGFTTAVPSLGGEVWYFVDNSATYGYVATYCADDAEGLESTYVTSYEAKFDESEWTLADYEGFGYEATSVETQQDENGVNYHLVVTFYSYNGTFYVFVELIEEKVAINVDRINELLAEQGWDSTLNAAVLAALGECVTGYYEEYDADLDEWYVEFTVNAYSQAVLNALIAGFAAALSLDGPYPGSYYNYGFLDYVWVNNTSTMELYFRILSLDDASFIVAFYIDQAPVAE